MNEDTQKAVIEEGRVERIHRILALYNINPETALWSVHGKAVIYHVALERIATKAGIVFDPPQIVRAEKDEAVMIVLGRMGAKSEWATGEALVDRNYKVKGAQAPYVYAMAEKRGKDRVVLKLIELHGDVYSEDEADDLKQQFDADAASQGLIREIDACKTHDDIEDLMKTKRVNEDLGRMPRQMSDHIKGYAKDAYRYMRSRSQVHGGGNGASRGRESGMQRERDTRDQGSRDQGFGRGQTKSEPHDEWGTSRQIRDDARERYEGRARTQQERTQTQQEGTRTQQRLPENASDRRDPPSQGFGVAGHKTPDEVLSELKEQFEFCHTIEEINATTDDFKDSIGRLTPPDIEAANNLRRARIAAIEAEDRQRS